VTIALTARRRRIIQCFAVISTQPVSDLYHSTRRDRPPPYDDDEPSSQSLSLTTHSGVQQIEQDIGMRALLS
jgi:hypothetical protein